MCCWCSKINWGLPNVRVSTMIATWWQLILHWKNISLKRQMGEVMERFFQANRAVHLQFFSLFKYFVWHINKSTTTDFKTCRKQCTQILTNACGQSSNCRYYCTCWFLKKCPCTRLNNVSTCTIQLRFYVVQDKNAGGGLKNLCGISLYDISDHFPILVNISSHCIF